MLSTPEPLADTSDAGFTVWVGGQAVQARYFETGREHATPSVTKLVVPASAVESAPDGASVVVTSAMGSWQFGALSKSSIR
jgi:hypothetical protein